MEVVDRDKAGIGVYGAIISITAEFRTAERPIGVFLRRVGVRRRLPGQVIYNRKLTQSRQKMNNQYFGSIVQLTSSVSSTKSDQLLSLLSVYCQSVKKTIF